MVKFSHRYKTFDEWFARQIKKTSYVMRVERLHTLYPKATLDQLRGHAKSEVKKLSKSTPKPVSARPWNMLSPREQLLRERALGVLSHARRSSQSLLKLSKEHGISVKSVLKATHGFKKVKGRWKAKKIDHISRIMAINEKGKELFIEVTNSRYATLIGKYHDAVKEYLNTGNTDILAEFEGKRVKDGSGKWHTFETNPAAIREINTRREEPEFYDIYQVNV